MFYKKLAKILNSNQSRSVVLSGNIYDLFNAADNGYDYMPLVDFLTKKCYLAPDKAAKGKTVVVYEINRSVKVHKDYDELKNAWNTFKGINRHPVNKNWEETKDSFDTLVTQTAGEPALAIEFLRQLTVCARQAKLKNDLVIIIEGAHLLMPLGNVSSLNYADRRRVGIFYDWLSDPSFINGNDSVILITESKSLINPMVAGLPVLANVEVPAPSTEDRREFAKSLVAQGLIKEVKHVETTAALSLYAYRQVLMADDSVSIIELVQEYLTAQLGEDVVEFKKPAHKLENVIGYAELKSFLKNNLIPRIQAQDDSSISGAAVAGPIGAGKSFIFEAFASELGCIVLVLKNLRSQWFGQTDVIFERLRRVLMALDKVVVFIDEADTQFGGVGPDTHETERRLTGKIQNMMSDPALRGKVFWLLMTARINLLSPDIRRPGRAGDLIIPVLDPSDDDRVEFFTWITKACKIETASDEDKAKFLELTKGYSSAAYASLRSSVKAEKCKNMNDIFVVMDDLLMPDHLEVRRYQTLQALMNCTRKSLIPQHYYKTYIPTRFAEEKTPDEIKRIVSDALRIARGDWQKELGVLELKVNY